MSRWITLTADHLKAAGFGTIVDRARTLAVGAIDPVQEEIDNATARVRRAVAPGNVLDADATKIPASFKGQAEKLALYALQERIGLLTPQQRVDACKPIESDLNRVSDHRIKCELADTPETTATVAETGMKITAVNVPVRLTGRDRTSGL